METLSCVDEEISCDFCGKQADSVIGVPLKTQSLKWSCPDCFPVAGLIFYPPMFDALVSGSVAEKRIQ